MLLGREPLDFDLVSYASIEDVASLIASRIGSRPFWMDEKRGVLRIVMKPSGRSIDISMPKGSVIEEDLLSRDITINAMGYDISNDRLIDPASGLHDLNQGIIRLLSEENLISDPIRSLRAIRFSVVLDFALEGETLKMIRTNGKLIEKVSPERIKQEVIRALDSPGGAKFFRLLAWAGLLPVIFSQYLPATGNLDNWHSVFRFAIPVSVEMDGLLYCADALMPGSKSLLNQEVEAGVSRASLLRLASILLGLEDARREGIAPRVKGNIHESESFGKRVASFCTSLRFSSPASRLVKNILGKQRLTERILSRKETSTLELYRFCKATEDYLPEALLLSLAWAQAHDLIQRQNATMIWEYYRDVYTEYKKKPLVTGDDVMKLLGRPAGPAVGECLRKVEEARASGIVRTRSEALKFLQSTSC
jgi:poly(A) polymerase